MAVSENGLTKPTQCETEPTSQVGSEWSEGAQFLNSELYVENR